MVLSDGGNGYIAVRAAQLPELKSYHLYVPKDQGRFQVSKQRSLVVKALARR